MYELHKQIYPETEKKQTEWFKSSIKTITSAILTDPSTASAVCARHQTPMAMLEYMYAKNNDGFIFYNSSVQEFLIINSDREVMDLVKNGESKKIFFDPSRSMTMKGDKGSPGVYFGPWPSSPEGKQYKDQQMSTEEWKKKLEMGRKVNQAERAEHGLAPKQKPIKTTTKVSSVGIDVNRERETR